MRTAVRLVAALVVVLVSVTGFSAGTTDALTRGRHRHTARRAPLRLFHPAAPARHRAA